MKIQLCSLIVEDQKKALKFYTDKLGFVEKTNIPAGEYRWITVASPLQDDIQLSLEPNVNPDARRYQQALFKAGIPLTAFSVEDIEAEYKELTKKDVYFTQPPTNSGQLVTAVFDDNCGNLIQIYQLRN